METQRLSDPDAQGVAAPAMSPAVQRLTLDSFRPQSLDDAVRGGALEHIQLTAGRFVGELLHAEIGGRVVDYGSYNLPLLAHGGMPADRIVLGFVASDTAEGNLNGETVGDGAVVVLVEGSALHYRLAPRTRWLGLQVSRDTLAQTGVGLGAESCTRSRLDRDRRRELAASVAAAAATLRGIARRDANILAATRAGAVVVETLTAVFAATLADDDQPPRSRPLAPAKRLRIVKRAREYFEAHLGNPIEIARLCTHASASMRTIERAFLDTWGANPKQMLTLMRMARARRMLQGAQPGETTVARTALDCGFFHLGRFSIHYAALFGEPPSATLRS